MLYYMKTIGSGPFGHRGKLDLISKIFEAFYRFSIYNPLLPCLKRYNLTISHKKKFIWFRTAKVCTRTILYHFKENIYLDVEHPTFIHYPPTLYNDYFKFAFVRNPWDRLVSCWFDKVLKANYYKFDEKIYNKMKSFENFVHFVSQLNIENCDQHLRLQSSLIDLNNIDYLGRQESFNIDFKTICKIIKVPFGNIKSRNVSKERQPYRKYYNNTLKEEVYNIYRKDIQIFNYTF